MKALAEFEQPRAGSEAVGAQAVVTLHTGGAWIPRVSAQGLATWALLAVTFVACSFTPLGSTELWHDLARGQAICDALTLDDAHFLREADEPRWLSGTMQWLVYRVGGAEFLVAWHALLAAVTVALLLRATSGVVQIWRSAWAATVGAACLVLSGLGSSTMEWADSAALALWLIGLAQFRRGQGGAWWLVFVALAWANIGKAVALGIALASGFVLEKMFFGRGRHQPISRNVLGLLAWMGACLVAGCLQSGGLAALVNSFETFYSHDRLGPRSTGVDMAPWPLLSLPILLLLSLILSWRSPRALTLGEWLGLALVALWGTAAPDSYSVWCIAWPWLVAPSAEAWLARGGWAFTWVSASSEAGKRRAVWAWSIAVIALLWSPPLRALMSGSARAEADIVAVETPYFMGHTVVERRYEGRLFASTDWAEYLRWRSRERLQPLVDPRQFNQRESSIDRSEAMRRLERADDDWLAVADRHEVRWLALANRRHAALFLRAQECPRARIRYQDQQGVLIELLPPAANDVAFEQHAQ